MIMIIVMVMTYKLFVNIFAILITIIIITIVTSCVEGRHNMPPPHASCQWAGGLQQISRPPRPDVRDRQTSDAHHRLVPPTLGAGHNNKTDFYSAVVCL